MSQFGKCFAEQSSSQNKKEKKLHELEQFHKSGGKDKTMTFFLFHYVMFAFQFYICLAIWIYEVLLPGQYWSVLQPVWCLYTCLCTVCLPMLCMNSDTFYVLLSIQYDVSLRVQYDVFLRYYVCPPVLSLPNCVMSAKRNDVCPPVCFHLFVHYISLPVLRLLKCIDFCLPVYLPTCTYDVSLLAWCPPTCIMYSM